MPNSTGLQFQSLNIVPNSTGLQFQPLSIVDLAVTPLSITGNQSVAVAEGGTTVGTYIANDAVGVVNWSLTSTDAPLLSINSGVVTLNAISDFEIKSSYSFNVVAVDDNTTTQLAVTLTILDVYENVAPVAQNQTFTIADDAAVGDVVGKLIASDVEAVTFSIVSGAGSTLYSINNDDVTVLSSLAGETQHVLTMRASDGTLASDFTVTINVTDQRLRLSTTTNLSDRFLSNTSDYGQLSIYQGESYTFRFQSPDLTSGWVFDVSLHKEIVGAESIYLWSGEGASISPTLSNEDTAALDAGDYIMVANIQKDGYLTDIDVVRLHVGLVG